GAINGASGRDLGIRARALSDEVVARWASLQRSDGRFPDPIYGSGGDYGTAMLGYAMLRRGVQRSDRALIQGGLDALVAQVKTPAGGAFELLILARAYRWAAGELPVDPIAAPLWAQAGPLIAADLSRRGAPTAPVTAKCYADSRCYNNLKLVSSLGAVELSGTGLTASSPSALLADPGLVDRVLHRLGSRVPKEVGDDVSRIGAAPIVDGGVLSDPPRNPLAYHALSTMMLGELIAALGDETPDAAREAFDRTAQALLALAAPDGDLTWFGRGQGQVWVPAVVADAAAQAAQRTTSAVDRGRFLALADASLTRLRTLYGVGASGLPLVPGAIDGPTLSARQVDPYATTRGYNGLAVDALDRAAATLETIDAAATRVPATRSGVVRSPSQAGVATITRGPLWLAIAGKSGAAEDARYGSGILALQRRDDAGNWASILPGRPYTPQVVGTIGIRTGGRTLVPSGAVRAVPGATAAVGVLGGWARPGGSKTVDPGTSWRWSVTDARTVELRFRVKAARTVVATGLVGDGATFQKVPFGFVVTSPDGTALQYSFGVLERRLGLERSVREGVGSAYDARVDFAQAVARVRKGEHVVLKIRVQTPPVSPGTGG
ncbi:MAG: hypothetical protein Q7T55_07130, partial [Solirubrobacteraceae bacterium]|nr:hypothetical protein [Solirubrobacteraceae bacterium]